MTRLITEADTRGGSALLPAGVRQYNIFEARIERNERNNVLELFVSVACAEGSGSFTVPLEAHGNLTEDTLCWLVGMNIGGLGIPVVGLSVEQIVQSLPAQLHGLINGIVELEVQHVQSTKLKDDGTPFVNDRVKVRRLVEHGTKIPPVAQQAHPGDQFFAASAGAPADDDIPFPAASPADVAQRAADGVSF